jgi:CxxC motif-containing protein (DUF1111 family)
VREARFINNPDGTPDGGVHGLYTIAGRTDAVGCVLPQPDFAAQLDQDNVIFRIPTPTFGAGLVEAVRDADLVANLAANADAKSKLGIAGVLQHSGNDGSVTRFGWKAQNRSLLIFTGEAYNVEQGVSNEAFPDERSAVPGCTYNGTPEDATDLETGASGDLVMFSAFMRLTAAPTPTTHTSSEIRGQKLFGTKDAPGIGCVHCHSDTLTTGASRYTGMSNVAIHPYSDFAIHHMGSGLADNVSQGAAGGDQFRTAPLWGVGQRIFFLHDGRSTPRNGGLVNAIVAHFGIGSEANSVINKFAKLSTSDQQAIVNFLRSL